MSLLDNFNFDKLDILLGMWASIATILSLFLKSKLTKNNKKNIVKGNNNGQMINADTYVNHVFNNPGKYSNNEIMRQAQLAFFAEDYEGARRLYSLDGVANNGIALCNIGYMYANGLGAVKNVEVAVRYYDRAIELGVDQAVINKFVVLANSENGVDLDKLYFYINDQLQNENGVIFNKFKEKNNGIPVYSVDRDFEKYCDEWKDTGRRIKGGSKPGEDKYTQFTIYYWIATIPESHNGNYGQYQIWAEQKRNFQLKEYFKDKFIMI